MGKEDRPSNHMVKSEYVVGNVVWIWLEGRLSQCPCCYDRYEVLNQAGYWQAGTVTDYTGTSESGKRYVVERDNAPGYPESFGIEDILLRT